MQASLITDQVVCDLLSKKALSAYRIKVKTKDIITISEGNNQKAQKNILGTSLEN